MISSDAGMQIDRSDEQRPKTSQSTIETMEFDSNVTVESLVHLAKQHGPMTSTDEGMQTVDKDEQ
jgi:hypothetical protein